MPAAYLQNRRFIRLSGPDAEHFLQNLITTDVDSLPPGEAWPGALLTPQGKILFDFMVWRDGDAFILETDAGQIEALTRRLTMYKLRAPVEIATMLEQGVTVVWEDAATVAGPQDVRFLKAGVRLVRFVGKVEDEVPRGDYDFLRVQSGVAASGVDFELQDAFPHDILMDLNGGLSFRKGCYVGQEVVSRMQHRGTARRRLAQVEAEVSLPPTGTEITAAGKPIGALGTVAGQQGLAVVRTDRVGAAVAAGVPLLAGAVALTAILPSWSGLSFPSEEGADS